MNKVQLYIYLHQRSLDKQFSYHSSKDITILKKAKVIMALILNVCGMYFKNKYYNTVVLRSAMYFLSFPMQKKCNDPSMLSPIKRITLIENE